VNSDSSQYLIQFRGKGDDYCAYMEPLKARLKKEHGLTIRCFEVWYDSKALELLQKLDRGRCAPSLLSEWRRWRDAIVPALIRTPSLAPVQMQRRAILLQQEEQAVHLRRDVV
jgi:hypothetical protein